MRERLEDLRDLLAYWAAWLLHPRRMRRMFHTVPPRAPEPPEPECDWFAWIGQPFYSCDRCGRPAWEHKGRLAPPESPFGAEQPETGIEWTDEERESCRRKWEPAMLAGAERRPAL